MINFGHTPYPKWVQTIAKEEWILQGKGFCLDIFNIGSTHTHVHRFFNRPNSRQGVPCWENIYTNQDYTLLKKRAIDNGYRSSDGLFNKDGKLDYLKLPIANTF